ncbi:hypothetical protein CHU32_26190 [Superficieibacter electus]|uniref:Uncharacterized protein n=1 Tax=Superficieibacter electus TaxID=2022662 RepID=A0A2P5GHB0_9ENTR|nr:hypothetical protein CHU33_26355 [Superficieibacter electus]POP41683.1 hypothetical protein CHU32_26190 [Superficieibacter electus]
MINQSCYSINYQYQYNLLNIKIYVKYNIKNISTYCLYSGRFKCNIYNIRTQNEWIYKKLVIPAIFS